MFPFFRKDGSVSRVMITSPRNSKIVLVPQRFGMFKASLFGFVTVAQNVRALPDADANLGRELDGLWHYDPWWILDHDRFEGHPAVPPIKSTNCAERLPAGVEDMEFDPRLGRAVAIRRNSEWEPFRADLLSRFSDSAPGSPVSTGGWRLAPMWEDPDGPFSQAR